MLEETKGRMSLDDLFSQIQEGNLKELNLIVKADVQGSVEAVKQSLMKLSNEEVVVKCIHGGRYCSALRGVGCNHFASSVRPAGCGSGAR